MMESIITYHAKEVSPHAVLKNAEELYAGGFFCCEAVMKAIRDAFQADVPESVIAMSSGMSIGAGRSGCMCGALPRESAHVGSNRRTERVHVKGLQAEAKSSIGAGRIE